MKDWKTKRKNRALRNSMIRIKNCKDKTSAQLLQRRVQEANAYLSKLKKKNEMGWFK
jgi:hypothetical protein